MPDGGDGQGGSGSGQGQDEPRHEIEDAYMEEDDIVIERNVGRAKVDTKPNRGSKAKPKNVASRPCASTLKTLPIKVGVKASE